MKTIKVFLASSDELQEDRIVLGNLVRKLDKIYEKRGIRIDLFTWEDYDAAYNGVRKQGEYNSQIKSSEMFLALFYKKAGKYTLEEFDVATEAFRQHASPKVYTYCKELHDGELESLELKEFKKRLFEEMGHYWCRYDNRDTLQLHFVMQLLLVESSVADNLTIEEGCIKMGGMSVAKMDNLQFVSNNLIYKKMRDELMALPGKIEKARSLVKLLPDNEDLQEDLQSKLDQYNALQKDFSYLQTSLFDTAKRIAEMQQTYVGDMLRRAIDSFNDGNIQKANVLLDEISKEADYHFEQMEKCQSLIHNDIDILRLQAKTVLSDLSIPVDTRVNKAKTIYEKADKWAKQCKYPFKRYKDLLFEYGCFLSDYAYYNESTKVYEESLLVRGQQDETPLDTATIMGNIGFNYDSIGEYSLALDWYLNALSLEQAILGNNHPRMANLYLNIGSIYHSLGDYPNSLAYVKTAVELTEKSSSTKPNTLVAAYNNLGALYLDIGDNRLAEDTLSKGLSVLHETIGTDGIAASSIYHNMGRISLASNDFEKALEYFFMDLAICIKEKGFLHPDTASSYHEIGVVYEAVGDYNKALDYNIKALRICESKLGPHHSHTTSSYETIGSLYEQIGETSKSLEYYIKALNSLEDNPDNRELELSSCYYNIANLYSDLDNWSKALENYFKSLHLLEKLYGDKHQNTMACYNSIGVLYANMHDYRKAIEFFLKSVTIRKELFGANHPSLASYYGRIGAFYYNLKEYDRALEYLEDALMNTEDNQGPEAPYVATLCYNMASSYLSKGEYLKSKEYAIRAKSIRSQFIEGDPSIDMIDSLLGVCNKSLLSD